MLSQGIEEEFEDNYDSTKPLNEDDFMQTQTITAELRQAVDTYGYGGEEEQELETDNYNTFVTPEHGQ